jgi:serine/threonine-protein kinase
MEFLRGKDLVGYAQPAHLLPWQAVASIGARVAEALHYAHGLNVVHRDIKPANIMYDPESDTVKVTDFGIARVTDASRTRTGMVLGTPSFMSPEQIAGKKVDGRSDLYSLGVMLYQLLSGTLPFRAESMAELMFKIANEPAPDVRTVAPSVPPSLAAVVTKAMAKRFDDRYSNGLDLARDLRQCLSSARTGSTDRPSVEASAPVNDFAETVLMPNDVDPHPSPSLADEKAANKRAAD